MGLTNPGRALGRFCLLLISPKLLILSGIPPFIIYSFRLASLLALLVGLNLFFLTGVLCVLSKSQKSILKRPSRCSARIRSLHCTFLSSSMIFRPLYLLMSAALFTLTTWLFGPPLPLGPHCGGSHTRSSVSIGTLV